MICKICESESAKIFSGLLFDRHKINYFKCNFCGFIQTEDPFWLEEAYKETINISDTGMVARNFNLSKILSGILFFYFDRSGKFLDFAGGYGLLTRIMRDMGFDFYWSDPYTSNIFAKGFEYKPSLGQIELVTSFEAFEHFVNPMKEIDEMLRISKNLLFTTILLPTPIKQPKQWWYYGLEHGQHIAFYSLKSLKFIADKHGLNLYSTGSTHLFTQKKISQKALYFFINTRFLGISNLMPTLMGSKTINDMNYIIRKLYDK